MQNYIFSFIMLLYTALHSPLAFSEENCDWELYNISSYYDMKPGEGIAIVIFNTKEDNEESFFYVLTEHPKSLVDFGTLSVSDNNVYVYKANLQNFYLIHSDTPLADPYIRLSEGFILRELRITRPVSFFSSKHNMKIDCRRRKRGGKEIPIILTDITTTKSQDKPQIKLCTVSGLEK